MQFVTRWLCTGMRSAEDEWKTCFCPSCKYSELPHDFNFSRENEIRPGVVPPRFPLLKAKAKRVVATFTAALSYYNGYYDSLRRLGDFHIPIAKHRKVVVRGVKDTQCPKCKKMITGAANLKLHHKRMWGQCDLPKKDRVAPLGVDVAKRKRKQNSGTGAASSRTESSKRQKTTEAVDSEQLIVDLTLGVQPPTHGAGGRASSWGGRRVPAGVDDIDEDEVAATAGPGADRLWSDAGVDDIDENDVSAPRGHGAGRLSSSDTGGSTPTGPSKRVRAKKDRPTKVKHKNTKRG